MRVIFTGQSGIDKNQVIENITNHIRDECGYKERSKEEKNKFLNWYSVESFVAPYDFGLNDWLQIPNENIQEDEWREGFANLLRQIKIDETKNVFLSMHSVFYRYSKFICPLDWEQIREFNPDLFITLIEDVQDIWWRLKMRNEIFPPNPTYRLREILAWRSVESMMTETLAQKLIPGKPLPHYIVAVKHPIVMMQRLLLDPGSLRIYAAYPISDVRNDKSMREVIDNHRKNLHERFVTFDPLSIDEFILELLLNKAAFDNEHKTTVEFLREDRWSVQSKVCNLPLLSDGIAYPASIELNRSEITEVSDEMKHHIEWRDYRLIDQAHCLTAYRPNYNKKASRGVSSEIMYALFSGIPIYIYWPEEDGDKIPFGTRGVIIRDYTEFIRSLEKHFNQERSDINYIAHRGKFIE